MLDWSWTNKTVPNHHEDCAEKVIVPALPWLLKKEIDCHLTKLSRCVHDAHLRGVAAASKPFSVKSRTFCKLTAFSWGFNIMTNPSTGFPVDGGPEWFTFGLPEDCHWDFHSYYSDKLTLVGILREVTLSLLLACFGFVCSGRKVTITCQF